MTVMPSWEECPKVFNVIFARVMKALKLVEVGRNKYDNKAAVSIPQHKLEVSRVVINTFAYYRPKSEEYTNWELG